MPHGYLGLTPTETLYALAVNPRDGRIAQCVLTGSDAVGLFDINNENVGDGNWNGAPDEAEEATGMPRVHLGYGVASPGHGWGTALYTAMAVGAEAHALGALPLAHIRTPGVGVCSDPENRTRSSTRWWDRAKGAGLARVVTGRDGRAYDVYPAAAARSHHLLLARIPRPVAGVTDWGAVPPASTDMRDAASLAAVNLSDLSPLLAEDADPDARDVSERQLRWLLDVASLAGVGAADLRAMEDRARTGAEVTGARPYRTARNPPGGTRTRAPFDPEELERRRASLGWGPVGPV